MLTPDSSRFWPREGYEAGKGQPSYDKQFVRDWLKQNLSEETIPSLKKLYEKKSSLQISLDAYKDILSDCKSQVLELDIVRHNVDSILQHQMPSYLKSHNTEL